MGYERTARLQQTPMAETGVVGPLVGLVDENKQYWLLLKNPTAGAINYPTITQGAAGSPVIIEPDSYPQPSAYSTPADTDVGLTVRAHNAGTLRIGQSTGVTALDGLTITAPYLNVAGALSAGNLAVSGAGTISGNLLVSGNATVNGALSAANLNITGAGTLSSLVVTGATSTVNLNVSGAATSASLVVTGSTSALNLNVSGAASLPNTVITSGNLNFNTTGQRIKADMNNVTFSSRLAFQTIPNGAGSNTTLIVVPATGGTIGEFLGYGGPDPDNAPFLQLSAQSNQSVINSNKTGTGTAQNLLIKVANTTILTLTSGGGLQIGSPTGADKGAGTINAANGVYDNGTRLVNVNGLIVPFTQGSPGVQAQGTTFFYGPSNSSSSEQSVEFVVPLAITVTKLYAQAVSVGGAGQTVTYTLRKNEADTTITCSIGSGATTGNDTAHSVSYAAGDRMSLKVVTSATTGNVQTFAGAA